MIGKRGLNAYQTNQTRSRAQVASPYRLVQIAFENLMDNLAKARGGIERGDAKVRGESLGKAMDVINILISALDHSVNPEISGNLEKIYRHSNRCLLDVNRYDDLDKLDEVVNMLGKIKVTWDQLEAKLHA